MLKTVVLAKNPFEPDTWVTREVADVRDFIMQEFEVWPETARIYQGNVSETNDVTPYDESGIEKLANMPGPFYVVVYPGVVNLIYAAIVAFIAVVVVAVVMKPSIPNTASRNTQQQSPNNELAERSNKPRALARIPDIYGTVRSTPDLIAVPYSVFVDHEEVEYAYMCIGRGEYDVSDVRDDTTLVSAIQGTSVEVFSPGKSPSTNDPYLRIGDPINTPVYNVNRSNAVNGQLLSAPNSHQYGGADNITFQYPDVLICSDPDVDFTALYEVDDVISLGNSSTTYTKRVQNGTNPDNTPKYEIIQQPISFNGVYTVSFVDADTVYFVGSPFAALDDAYVDGTTYFTKATAPCSASLDFSSTDDAEGPFDLDMKSMSQIWANFVALNGLYKDDGENQVAANVTLQLEATPITADGSPRGAKQTFNTTLDGSATSRTTRAGTLKCNLSMTGMHRVFVRRLSPTDKQFKGSVVDEVKVRDLYAVAPFPAHPIFGNAFGNVTTVHAVTKATSGALAVKERKLNLIASRRIESRQPNGAYIVMPTSNAADIFRAVCFDKNFGNRNASEVDLTSVYDAANSVTSYFGTAAAAQFNYTFDNSDISFEEAILSIADAIFCQAYRRGNVIKLSFEQATQDSVLLFNHRNKLPGTETRTVNFGFNGDNDGVEYQYVDPTDDALVTLYLPNDRSAVNPKKIESVGIRSRLQAYFHAWRNWNKIRYSNQTIEFEATQEVDLVIPQDRILVADNTRPDTQDGDVITQNGLELELSHDVSLTSSAGYTVFIQHYDGAVEAIQINRASASNRIVLSKAPRAALALGDDLYAKATYVIVGNNSARQTAFLVTEKTPNDGFTSTVKGVNYDERYYANDDDYKTGVVNADGTLI